MVENAINHSMLDMPVDGLCHFDDSKRRKTRLPYDKSGLEYMFEKTCHTCLFEAFAAMRLGTCKSGQKLEIQ